MSIFDRFRSAQQPTTRNSASSGETDMTVSEQEATRLIEEGHALEANGKFDEALQRYSDAIRIAPNPARAHLNYGNAKLLKRDLQGALNAFKTALKYKPDYSGAYFNMGNALLNNGQVEEAIENYQKALEIQPEYAEAHCALGVALQELGLIEAAANSHNRALKYNPHSIEAHNNLGIALQALGNSDDAVLSYQRALDLNPNLAEVHSNLSMALHDLGEIENSKASRARALELNPNLTDARSCSLFELNFTNEFSRSQYLEKAREYGHVVSKRAGERYTSWICDSTPERLRIGLVSGDLINHPVGFFLKPLLLNIDHSRIEIIAYPTNRKEDDLTAQIKPCFAGWKPLLGKNDANISRMIHEDGVHILIDLAGHTDFNRLPLFAWKPAPIQVSWLGYFASTGVSEIDYLLADKVGVPESQQNQFTETIWYLPDTRLCFSAPEFDLPVTPLPALSKGAVTFGCFQNLPKINNEVLGAWSEILSAIPNAILRIQRKQLGEPEQNKRLVQRLQEHNIEPERVKMHGDSSRRDYLAVHSEIDIILDTFPYTGGTTTCEALWMGVPTLTLTGGSLLARQGASLLTAAGLNEWIAESKEEYVTKAINFARDIPKLASIRSNLRQQALSSPLYDAPRFARNFEDAMWEMWHIFQTNQNKT